MARPQPVDPVKLFVAVLWCDEAALEEALAALREHWGRIDSAGPDQPFDVTDYYEPEMGRGLQRRLVTFAELVPPENIRQAKLICNEVEDRLAGPQGRRVNLDVGYLDHNKIVLASVKYAGQKIHLGDGIYADLVARYKGGRYQPFEWTFPDFRDGRYDDQLAQIRRTYLSQLRSRR
jgi:hypothetical protein